MIFTKFIKISFQFLFICLVLFSLMLFGFLMVQGYQDDAYSASAVFVLLIAIQNAIPFSIYYTFSSMVPWLRILIWAAFVLIISSLGLYMHFFGREASDIGIPIVFISILSPFVVLIIYSQHKREWYYLIGGILFIAAVSLALPIARL